MNKLKPCEGCKWESKYVACKHPESHTDKFWLDTSPDENGYPWCYEKEKPRRATGATDEG